MNFSKLQKFCPNLRIVLGLILIAIAIYTGIHWFYLGIIPLVIGLTKFCPICLLTHKCDIPQYGEKK